SRSLIALSSGAWSVSRKYGLLTAADSAYFSEPLGNKPLLSRMNPAPAGPCGSLVPLELPTFGNSIDREKMVRRVRNILPGLAGGLVDFSYSSVNLITRCPGRSPGPLFDGMLLTCLTSDALRLASSTHSYWILSWLSEPFIFAFRVVLGGRTRNLSDGIAFAA